MAEEEQGQWTAQFVGGKVWFIRRHYEGSSLPRDPRPDEGLREAPGER